MHHASLRGLSRQLATAGVSTRETSVSCSGLASRLLATAASPSATTAVPRPTEQLRAVIVGAPGSGKGTHSTAIVRLWPTVQNIVSGNLLRGEMEAQTPLGLEAAEVMRRGGLLPDDIMATLLEPHLNATDRDLLLDGFPRTVGQARLLDEQMKKSNRPLNLVINLNVPEELILQRIEGRWYHPPSGRVYNDTYNPPKRSGLDDITGEPLEKRVDDSRAVFGKRIRLFNEQSQPMLDYYREEDQKRGQQRLVTVSGDTSKVIWPKIKAIIEERYPHLANRAKDNGP